MERFLRYDQNCVKKLPLVKIRKNKTTSEISLSQLLNFRNIQNLPLDICFVDDKCDAISWNFFAYHQRRQNPRWPPIMVKKSFSVLGKQQDTQIMKFNSTQFNSTQFYCHIYIIFKHNSAQNNINDDLNNIPQVHTRLVNKHVFISIQALVVDIIYVSRIKI